MRSLIVRIESLDQFKAHARVAAERIDKGDLDQPEIYSFESLPRLFETFTANRWTLLQKLMRIGPSSLRGLARALGRDVKRVHEDVAALIEKGIIERDDNKKLVVPFESIHIDAQILASAA